MITTFFKKSIDNHSVIYYYDTMMIIINNKNAQSVREQIKRQLKMQIEKGELQIGKPAPSIRDLAALLNVNRNTVASAYKELTEEGILETIIGAGTFVRAMPSQDCKQALYQVIAESVKKAFTLGYGVQDITDCFFNCLASLPVSYSDFTVMVVECNEPLLDYFCDEIARQCNVKTKGILIDELEKDPLSFAALLADIDLIVCGFNHVEELVATIPTLAEKLVGCILQTDLEILNKITQLPDGVSVGYVCVNQRSAETFYNSSFFSGHKQLKRIIAGLNSTETLHALLQECNTVFVTNFAYEQVIDQIRPDQELIRVDITLDVGSINLIKERIMRIARKY